MPDSLPERREDSRSLTVSKLGALRFVDKDFEHEYQLYHLAETRPQTRLLALCAALASVVYLSVDAYYTSGRAFEFIQAARVFYMLPVTLSWVILGGIKRIPVVHYYRWLMISGVPILLIFPMMTYLSDGDAVLYGSIAQTQVVAFLTVLLRYPMAFVIPSTAITLVPTVLLASIYGLAPAEYYLAIIPVVSIGLLTLIVAYRMDYDSRRAYVTERTFNELVEKERAVEADRINWLQNLSRFLKHEFRNAMLGVSTSLDRLDRQITTDAHRVYVDRARDSLSFMRNLLGQTADAASISSALEVESPEIFNVSDVVTDRAAEFALTGSGVTLTPQVDPNCYIEGDPVRLAQVLDKLLTNALEHSHGPHPVFVRLYADGDRVQLEVENRGDALSGDIEQLTGLFESTKRSSRNLGLGLYVADRIVRAHKGSLTATPLSDPAGALFRVSIPAATTT